MTRRDDDSSRWLAEALATRDLEKLKPSMAAAGDRVNDARRHVRSARGLADDDPTLGIAACHDAIRKAITGHMRAAGYRPRSGEGAHRIVLDYAHHLLGGVVEQDDLRDTEAIRKDRGLAVATMARYGPRRARTRGRRGGRAQQGLRRGGPRCAPSPRRPGSGRTGRCELGDAPARRTEAH